MNGFSLIQIMIIVQIRLRIGAVKCFKNSKIADIISAIFKNPVTISQETFSLISKRLYLSVKRS